MSSGIGFERAVGGRFGGDGMAGLEFGLGERRLDQLVSRVIELSICAHLRRPGFPPLTALPPYFRRAAQEDHLRAPLRLNGRTVDGRED